MAIGLCIALRERPRHLPPLRGRDPPRDVGKRLRATRRTLARVMDLVAIETQPCGAKLHAISVPPDRPCIPEHIPELGTAALT